LPDAQFLEEIARRREIRDRLPAGSDAQRSAKVGPLLLLPGLNIVPSFRTSSPLTLTEFIESLDADTVGNEMYALATKLYPFCRSITGEGLRRTLRTIQEEIALEIAEVPTGTQVFDWTVPNEWNIRDAYIKDSRGTRVVDFRRHNLHVVNYSAPVHRRMPLAELKPHLHTLPDKPDWIPYRTSYYKETWGFCLAHREFEKLEEGE